MGSLEQDIRSTQTLNAATLNATVSVPVNGQGTLGFAISGLAASGATLTFEQSEDGGTTWTVVNEVNAGTGVATSTRTTDGQTRIATSGRTNIRFRVSTTGTGTITIAYSLSVREGMVTLASPALTGQYNTTLPTLTTGQFGVLAVDANGRQILSPTVTLPVSAVTLPLPTGAATAANQNSTAAGTSASNAQGVQGVTGGVAMPISVSTLPLPAGAATSANQSSEIAALGTTGDTAYAGSGTASIIALLKGNYAGLVAPTPAGTNIIGKVGIDQTTPGTTNGVQINNQATQTTTGAIEPPTAAAGKITKTSTALTANTSTTIAAANTSRIALAIQCGSGGVSVDETGAALTAAGVGNGTLFIPTGTGPYFTPPIATRTALTAYTATAQTCVVTEYNR